MPEYVVEYGKAGATLQSDGRLDAPAYHRNREPIWSVLGPFLEGRTGDVLELGSGTGQHVVDYAGRSPQVAWWPSDVNDAHLTSIAAWRTFAKLGNVRAPSRIDLLAPDWRVAAQGGVVPGKFLAILCANVIHISPWQVTQGLFRGAARHLAPDGRLFLYGPFKRNGQHTAPSNAAFDASLRAGNSEWGVRDLADVDDVAAAHGLRLAETVEMPANNLIAVFARNGSPERRI